jgi:hypothetical protein
VLLSADSYEAYAAIIDFGFTLLDIRLLVWIVSGI